MVQVHKQGQGVLSRRFAFWGLTALIVWGGQTLYTWLVNRPWGWNRTLLFEDGAYVDGIEIPVLGQRLDTSFIISWALVVAAIWLIFKLLNKPRQADFLIDTDEELKKVTWPSWKDAWSSSLIVIVFVLFLALYLWGADLGLSAVFNLIFVGS